MGHGRAKFSSRIQRRGADYDYEEDRRLDRMAERPKTRTYLGVYCPSCKQDVTTNSADLCVWCDTLIPPNDETCEPTSPGIRLTVENLGGVPDRPPAQSSGRSKQQGRRQS